MANTNDPISGALSSEPENKNFLSPLGFRFAIRKLPHVNWFLQSVNVPGITGGEAAQPTPFYDAAQPGEKLIYDPLNITFKVDEDMKNWQELYDWMVGIFSPTSFQEYRSNVQKHGAQAIVSDATLIILNSNMNGNFEILFRDLFPLSLSELTFDSTSADVDYLTASATFRFLNFSLRKVAR